MLKWLALIFMVIDHLAYYFYTFLPEDVYIVMRTIGRLAFPIFAYGIVLGARRTRNISRYFLRLAVFAILGQVMMEMAARYVNQETFTNVLFTLMAGLMLIVGIELATKSMQDVVVSMRPVTVGPGGNNNGSNLFNIRVNLKGITMPSWLGILIGTVLITSSLLLVVLLEPDYGLFGMAAMLLFYILENQLEPYSHTLSNQLKQKRFKSFFIGFGLLNLVNMALNSMASPANTSWAVIGLFSTFSVCFFQLQGSNEKRPAAWQKYFFYIFYPLHISILMILAAKLGA